MYGRIVFYCVWFSVLVMIILLAGCITNPQARADAQRLSAGMENAAQDLIALEVQAGVARKRILEVKALIESKELTTEKGFVLAAQSYEQYSVIRERIASLKAHQKAMKSSWDLLRKKYDTPWYELAGFGLVSLLTGTLGTSLIGRVSHNKTRGMLEMARSGLEILVGGIERASDPEDETVLGASDIKRLAFDYDNPEIESAVSEMQRENVRMIVL